MANNLTYDPEAYRDFERAAWAALPESYQEHFGFLTAQAAEPLIDAVGTARTRRRASMMRGLMASIDLAALLAIPAQGWGVIIYPAKGQSADQQQQDGGEREPVKFEQRK